MTTYPPINPDGKPACWPRQHNEQIAGLCDACGQHARLYAIAEGPICGPAAICADCIWTLTPRDRSEDQPLFALAQREIESRRRPKTAVSTHVIAPARYPAPPLTAVRQPELVCEGQLAFDFPTPDAEPPAAKTPAATPTQPPAPANPGHCDRPRLPAASAHAAATGAISDGDGIPCDTCDQLIRVHLDNAVVGRAGERCCLDCFEARYHLEPFITTTAWLTEHGAELDQDWRFVHDVADLMPDSAF